jgi:hypothetical protein
MSISKLKVCIIHHIEPMWSNSFDEYDLMESIIDHFENNQYDLVIMTTLEGCGSYDWLRPYYDREEAWSYTWDDPEYDPEWYSDCGININDIIPATGHEWAYVYPWIKDLNECDISLMGGHRNECLQDLIDTLEHLEYDYNLINECIY